MPKIRKISLAMWNNLRYEISCNLIHILGYESVNLWLCTLFRNVKHCSLNIEYIYNQQLLYNTPLTERSVG